MFFKIGGLKNLAYFHRKTLVSEYLFDKITGQRDSNTSVFSVNIAKFLKTPFFTVDHLRWLFLPYERGFGTTSYEYNAASCFVTLNLYPHKSSIFGINTFTAKGFFKQDLLCI